MKCHGETYDFLPKMEDVKQIKGANLFGLNLDLPDVYTTIQEKTDLPNDFLNDEETDKTITTVYELESITTEELLLKSIKDTDCTYDALMTELRLVASHAFCVFSYFKQYMDDSEEIKLDILTSDSVSVEDELGNTLWLLFGQLLVSYSTLTHSEKVSKFLEARENEKVTFDTYHNTYSKEDRCPESLRLMCEKRKQELEEKFEKICHLWDMLDTGIGSLLIITKSSGIDLPDSAGAKTLMKNAIFSPSTKRKNDSKDYSSGLFGNMFGSLF